jgi:hypothetical protein
VRILRFANPVAVTGGAFRLTRSAVGVVDTAVRGTAHVVRTGLHELGKPDRRDSGDAYPDEARATDPGVDDDSGVTEDGVEGAVAAPAMVPVEPRAPEEPPVDVVGQALAAEARRDAGVGAGGAGFAHEPRGASRADEHGDLAWQRLEADEISDEIEAALEGDPEEQHLTEPLLAPGQAETLAAELRRWTPAADSHQN